MTPVELRSLPEADADIESAFEWYERNQANLGHRFLAELRACYARISSGPLKYQVLRGEIRRALLKRFPYAVYFVAGEDHCLVLAVLHAGRDPEHWQTRLLPR